MKTKKSSIRRKLLLLVLFSIVMTVFLVGYAGANLIGKQADESKAEVLNIACAEESENVNHILKRVELSVRMSSEFAEDLLNSGMSQDEALESLQGYMEEIADSTDNCLSYYFIKNDPFNPFETGFFYTLNALDNSYVSQETVMLGEGGDTDWMTYDGDGENPDWTVPHQYAYSYAPIISCIMPIYKGYGMFGYVGIDVNFQDITESISNVTGYETGDAFLISDTGVIYSHRYLSAGDNPVEENPEEFAGLLEYFQMDNKTSMTYDYTYRGVEKSLASTTLSNGMELCLSAERSEVDADRRSMMATLLPVALITGILFSLITVFVTDRITKPLRSLTTAARRVANGDMNDVHLDVKGHDEISELSDIFNGMVEYLRIYIRDVERDAYVDKLTGVKNAKAYRNSLAGLEEERKSEENIAFGIAMFDLNDLKKVNDVYGHEEGNAYILNACRLISRTFENSPVFRIGGDEFVTILRNYDFVHFQELGESFVKEMNEMNEKAENPWEEVHIAMGFAFYTKGLDKSVDDVFRRADEAMYRNKRIMKNGAQGDIDR